MSTSIRVWDGETLAGVAYCTATSETEMAVAFTYDQQFLESPHSRQISPEFPLYKGGFQTTSTPGAFRDASPDSWGRSLIRQEFAEKRMGRTPNSVDFLLGASDLTRQGSLRFERDGVFEMPAATVPKLIDIEKVANLVGRAGSDSQAAVELLRGGAGSSGGAVPKAAVSSDESLWLAKFYGDSDLGLWEHAVSVMARQAGINVAETKLVKAGAGMAFLSHRFDRSGTARIPYLSGASLAELKREESGDYLHLVWVLRDKGSHPDLDVVELWRRMAFSVAVNNADDHFGNHGFLWGKSGWRLAPMFDVTPSDKAHRKTSISGVTSREDMLAALMDSAADFGLGREKASQVIRETWAATRRWASVGKALGASRQSITEIEFAFDGLRAKAESTK